MLKSIALLSIGTLILATVAHADTVKIGTTEFLSTLPGAESYQPAKRQARYEDRSDRSTQPSYVAPAETQPEKPYHSPLLAKVRAKENSVKENRSTAKTSRHHHVVSKRKSQVVSSNADQSSQSNDLLGKVRAQIRGNH